MCTHAFDPNGDTLHQKGHIKNGQEEWGQTQPGGQLLDQEQVL